MTPAGPVVQSGMFVAVGSGFRFRLVSEPSAGDVLGTIVFVHAFAEEMNKSRRMAARMARRLAADGWRVVQRDLCGCGDSSGDFAEAAWDDWLGDVDAELTQAANGRPVWLWCERAGALLAAPMLAKHPKVQLLLWQPVLSGAQHLQQFLRLDAGARIVGSTKTAGGRTPIERLRAGESVEIGGYGLGPALALGLDRASFDLPASFAGRVVWFELSTDDAAEPSLPATRLLERLRGDGVAVELTVLRGPPFWQTQEIEDAEALLDSTGAALRAKPTSSERQPMRAVGTGCVVQHEVSR